MNSLKFFEKNKFKQLQKHKPFLNNIESGYLIQDIQHFFSNFAKERKVVPFHWFCHVM